MIEASSDDPTVPGVIFDALLVAVALAVGFWAPGPLRSASVTAIVLAVPLVWGFAFFGNGTFNRGAERGVYLLTVGTYSTLYLLGWTKGRAIFLAGALLFFASWATFEVAGSGSTNVVPFQSSISGSTSSSGTNFGLLGGSTITTPSATTTDANTDAAATVALFIGLVFLGVGAALDRKRYEGAATPFIAVGAFETLVGAIVLGGDQSLLLGGLLALAAGGVVGMVGARGERRRATTWIGVLAVFGGLVAVLVDIAPTRAAEVGGIAFGFALALGLIAWWLAPVLGEPDDGNDQPELPPPAPPGGTTTVFPETAAA